MSEKEKDDLELVAGKAPKKVKRAIAKVGEKYHWTESQTLRQILILDPLTLDEYKKQLKAAWPPSTNPSGWAPAPNSLCGAAFSEREMNLLERIKRLLGWTDCPACDELVWLRFMQITIVFPDEPPMFGRYRCPKCEWLSPIHCSVYVDAAVRSLGYKDLEEWAHKNVPELKENRGTPQ
jgi:hypothetical protein